MIRFCSILLRFCGNFYFKLRYWGFTKPSGLWYLEILMRFAVFLLFCAVFIRNSVRFCDIPTPLTPPSSTNGLRTLSISEVPFCNSKLFILRKKPNKLYPLVED